MHLCIPKKTKVAGKACFARCFDLLCNSILSSIYIHFGVELLVLTALVTSGSLPKNEFFDRLIPLVPLETRGIYYLECIRIVLGQICAFFHQTLPQVLGVIPLQDNIQFRPFEKQILLRYRRPELPTFPGLCWCLCNLDRFPRSIAC